MNLHGHLDEHLALIASELGVKIQNRSNHYTIIGPAIQVQQTIQILTELYEQTANHHLLSPTDIYLAIKQIISSPTTISRAASSEPERNIPTLYTLQGKLEPRNYRQRQYIQEILKNDISFGIGPAGTGKTYLAVALAVHFLKNEKVKRIILVRPAVEAGEHLGFLPGDLSQKVDPYLRPLYDALYDMLGIEKVNRYIERNIIEIAPLAYMRGRTLNDAFVILDESQNTTLEQMKMFLTRTGFGSKVVITGDITQIDLPRNAQSGLKHVMPILKNVPGLGFSYFENKDVVRHPIVQHIVEAYDDYEQNKQ
jgi:phosphate starvation-inducible PhoH-like protein